MASLLGELQLHLNSVLGQNPNGARLGGCASSLRSSGAVRVRADLLQLPPYHEWPEDSLAAFEEVYSLIQETTRMLKPHSVTQICSCGTPPTFSLLPHYDQAVTADPTAASRYGSASSSTKRFRGPRRPSSPTTWNSPMAARAGRYRCATVRSSTARLSRQTLWTPQGRAIPSTPASSTPT